MERKELEEMAGYCNTADCDECYFREKCDDIEGKITITGLVETTSNVPEYWDNEDINYILAEINKEDYHV